MAQRPQAVVAAIGIVPSAITRCWALPWVTARRAALISRSPSGPCPPSVRLESRDAFSATWVAPLRPAYQQLRFEVASCG